MSRVGLTSAEATERRQRLGANEIRREKASSRWALVAGQFQSPLVWLLLGACVVSGALGELADAIAIAVIVVANAAVGFFQESRAERAIFALRAMTAPRARVLRDGHQAVVTAADVVPGDALLLEAGDVVAADGRLIEAHALTTNEAALTGESLPISKSAGGGLNESETSARIFMGTAVASGTGVALVSATGMATELGHIALLIETAQQEPTPLQKRLAKVGRVLLIFCLGTVAVTAALGLLRGQPALGVFLSAVSLAVAAVPEGLPAIVTIALAVGVQRMAARHVLVRKLSAAETLGSATIICTDKTGTLTTGVMQVREVWGVDHQAVIRAAAACCDAELGNGDRADAGDPTEIAILAKAFEHAIRREQIEAAAPRRQVTPFDPDRRRMAVLRADDVLYVKGAFESIAPLCSTGDLAAAAQSTVEMAGRGFRVLAVATGRGPKEAGLLLVGLIGIADPPRSEAIQAVAAARSAGIRTVMLTGDHPVTAAAIAREMGIVRPGDDPAMLVHARATPEDKLRLVRSWKAQGAVVAMTGDGVNDAPALREAHVGIAMGLTGTEVTREASDLVLADDNYASIIAAIREGRGIFDNIRKTLVYLLAGNTGELLVMLGAALLAMPLPLLPLHLLWINLLTDGFPALALVMDPSSEDVMGRPPRAPSEPMLGRLQWLTIGSTGLLQGAVTLGVFVWRLRSGDLAAARTLAFSTLVFGELLRAFAARSPTKVLWEVGAFSNLRLLVVVAASVLAQLAILTLPPAQRLFQIAAPTGADLGLALGLGLIPVSVIEMAKFAARIRWPGRSR